MQIGRVLQQRRQLLGLGLTGLLASAFGCGDNSDLTAEAPLPVQPKNNPPAPPPYQTTAEKYAGKGHGGRPPSVAEKPKTGP
jgi:hypothetical protein